MKLTQEFAVHCIKMHSLSLVNLYLHLLFTLIWICFAAPVKLVSFSSQLTRLFLIPLSLLLSTFAYCTSYNIRNNPLILKHCHLNNQCIFRHYILTEDFSIVLCPISIRAFYVGVQMLRLSDITNLPHHDSIKEQSKTLQLTKFKRQQVHNHPFDWGCPCLVYGY